MADQSGPNGVLFSQPRRERHLMERLPLLSFRLYYSWIQAVYADLSRPELFAVRDGDVVDCIFDRGVDRAIRRRRHAPGFLYVIHK